MERAQRINQIDNGTAQQATGVRGKVRHQSAPGTAARICGGWHGESKVQCSAAKISTENRVANRAGDGEKKIRGALERVGMRCVGWCGKAKQSAGRQKSAQKIRGNGERDGGERIREVVNGPRPRPAVTGQALPPLVIVSDISLTVAED
jgi:hypothetical protein